MKLLTLPLELAGKTRATKTERFVTNNGKLPTTLCLSSLWKSAGKPSIPTLAPEQLGV